MYQCNKQKLKKALAKHALHTGYFKQIYANVDKNLKSSDAVSGW